MDLIGVNSYIVDTHIIQVYAAFQRYSCLNHTHCVNQMGALKLLEIIIAPTQKIFSNLSAILCAKHFAVASC